MFNKIFVITGFMIALLGGRCLSTFDPISIFHIFFDAFRKQHASVIALKLSGMLFVVAINFAVPHIWCRRLCPLGGLQDMLRSFNRLFAKKRTKTSLLPTGRRLVLGILLGFGVKLTLHRVIGPISKAQIRPPGALPDEQFKTVCYRCGNCSKACPTDIIRSSFDPSDIMGLLTPHIEFDTGYCLPECTACGNVCPSTAIRRFTKQDKQKLIMGIASIQSDKCLLSEHKECDLCYRYCTYEAVEIRSSDRELSARPEILTDICVGCGACMVVCPTLAIVIVVS
jgi:ferredoxin-type protein NapF